MNYSREHKQFKEWELVKRVGYSVVWSIFLTLVLLILAINIFNLRLDMVLTNSMVPAFTDRDIIISVPQDEYKVGDSGVYKAVRNGKEVYVTHRILEIYEETGEYKMQGDANSNHEIINKEQVVAKHILTWKNGRFVYSLIHDNYILVLTLVIACWGLSSILAGEKEMKVHDIARD